MTNNKGWIKLHRQALDNDVRRFSPSAWRLFETLLLVADTRTGMWAGGRKQLAKIDGSLSEYAVYRALATLKNAKMCTLMPNTKYTEIYICNWQSYQQVPHTNAEQQPHNGRAATAHYNKNKEVIIKKLEPSYKKTEEYSIDDGSDYNPKSLIK